MLHVYHSLVRGTVPLYFKCLFLLLTKNYCAKLKMNVLGTSLISCSAFTGWTRTGYCTTDHADHGFHVVCARVTKEFLQFTKQKGNDLVTPRPGFPGLKPGDFWCLCAARWIEAYKAGKAPPVVLEATNHKVLQMIPLRILQQYQL